MDEKAHRLVLDIGNSRMKLGLFHGGCLVRQAAVSNGDLPGVKAFLGDQQVDAVAVGTVKQEDAALADLLSSLAPMKVINGLSPAHLRNGYSTPETLGADRWANAVAASLLFPGRAVLTIALGTCVIYDLVDRAGLYRGGIISPGARMRAQAMHGSTARLPSVEPVDHPERIGVSTVGCLQAGVYHGLRSELLNTIAEIRQQHPGLVVVLTGGDGLRFARALENGIFAHPFLTLYGLYALSLFDRTAADPIAPLHGR